MAENNTPSIHNPPTEILMRDFDRNDKIVPFEWGGEFYQERVLQGLAIAATSESVTIIVTHTNDEKSPDTFHGDSDSAWFQQISDSDYKSLSWISDVDTEKLNDETIKRKARTFRMYDDSPGVKPGDTLHVHQSYFLSKPTPDSSQWKTASHVDEVCLLPNVNIGVEAGLDRLAKLRVRLARQLVRSAKIREHLTMIQNPRIDPNNSFRPFGEAELDDKEKTRIKARRVYGAGQVDDHFVDIKADIQRGTDEEIRGDLRFTTKGGVVITPQIAPLGEGSEHDPLMKVEIHIHSSNVHNRAVGEQQAYILIDGVKYVAEKDPEISSQYFENPGHDVYFAGFRPEGVSKNTFTLTEEQRQAYFDKGDAEHTATRDFINEMISKGKDPYKSNPEMNAELEKRIAQVLAADAERAGILETIGDNPLDSDVNCGAPLVVPRSMLDSIEIVFPSINDTE